tara:strand:- start:19664 stop:20149 length:486 start_codon:yes stop_codon:yes gene_type:complete
MIDSGDYQEHFAVVREGLRIHEEFRYAAAIKLFRKALKMSPGCPTARYNLANSLYMVGRYPESLKIFEKLTSSDDDELRRHCPDMVETPRSLKLDAFYMMFCGTLYQGNSWRKALPFLREHLHRRTRGLQSLFSRATILSNAEELRQQFAPRAKPIDPKRP